MKMAKIEQIQPNNSAVVIRGYEDEMLDPDQLPDGAFNNQQDLQIPLYNR